MNISEFYLISSVAFSLGLLSFVLFRITDNNIFSFFFTFLVFISSYLVSSMDSLERDLLELFRYILSFLMLSLLFGYQRFFGVEKKS